MRPYLHFLLILTTTVTAQAQCNSAPMAADDAINAHHEALLVDILANDTDDGLALDVAVIGNTCNVAVNVDEFELLELALTENQPVRTDCAITYMVSDDEGLSDIATVADSLITDVFADSLESGDTSRWSEVAQQ